MRLRRIGLCRVRPRQNAAIPPRVVTNRGLCTHPSFRTHVSRDLRDNPPENASRNDEVQGTDNYEGQNQEQHDEPPVTRTVILDAALTCVHEYGWSIESLSQGAADTGYTDNFDPAIFFPRGAVELVDHFIIKGNQKLCALMQVLSLVPLSCKAVRTCTSILCFLCVLKCCEGTEYFNEC
jgi:hypothetical protein